jgi:hypothetical protein
MIMFVTKFNTMSQNGKSLKSGIWVFCDHLIDYAGMFPPAGLDINDAFDNYCRYISGRYGWIINNFVVPARKLNELSALVKGSDLTKLAGISVILSGGRDENEFLANVQDDFKILHDIKSNRNIKVNALEARIPAELTDSENQDELVEFLINFSGLVNNGYEDIPVFLEAAMSDDYEKTILNVTESIACNNIPWGYKLRTGGTEPSSFPPAQAIAYAIMCCIEFGIPMKCTAGLHHPIRHYDEKLDVNVHGFFNVFIAGLMAYALDLSEEEIIQVVEEEDPYEFDFTDGSVEYGDFGITVKQIAEAREKLMTSFGSCSFDEPIADLKTLGLLN